MYGPGQLVAIESSGNGQALRKAAYPLAWSREAIFVTGEARHAATASAKCGGD
jgi:hypothetical protein